MKYCPTCKRSFPDDAPPFCSEDGTHLVAGSAPPPPPPAAMPPPPPTPPRPPSPVAPPQSIPPLASSSPPPARRGCGKPLLIGCAVLLLGFFLLIGISAIFLAPVAASRMTEWGDGLCTSMRYEEAVTMYSRAAFLGNAHAQAMLAGAYGQVSKDWRIRTDWDTALRWAKKAAAKNDAEGEFLLGSMYYAGRGVPKDFGQARYWAKKAINEGVCGGHPTGFHDEYIVFGKEYAHHLLRWVDEEEKGTTRAPSRAPTVQSSPTASVMTVDELEAAFKRNATSAEAVVKGKTFPVTGTVDWVGVGLYDKKPAINLIGSGATAHTNCAFPDSAKAAVNSLRVGQKVTIRAEFGGYVAGYISLKNCEVVR